MKKMVMISLMVLILYCTVQAQLVRRDEKVRFGFGVSAFASAEQLNEILHGMEEITEDNGLLLPLPDFIDHPVLFLDYESKIGAGYYYQFSVQYAQEGVNNANEERENHIQQGLEYTLTLLQISASLVRHFPIYILEKGNIDVVAGAGAELIYANADWSYVYSQLPLRFQKIEFIRTGFILGGRLFLGIEAPVTSSLLLQLRGGYSLMPENKLSGKVKSANLQQTTGATEPIDPDILIKKNKYNFSNTWLTFGLAYFF